MKQLLLTALSAAILSLCHAQEAPAFSSIQSLANREISLQLNAEAGKGWQLQFSTNGNLWLPVSTLISTGANNYADSRAPYLPHQLYRAAELSETNLLTGDHIQTSEGEVLIHPIDHASFLMTWNGKVIYNDPAGSSALYTKLPKADLILVSHSHGDHFNASIISSVKASGGQIIAPQAVYNSLSTTLKASTIVLTNGASTTVLGLTVEAVPAYNSNHPKGQGNGYVTTIGGKRFYMSGDTGDTAEMRALQNIDVAFLCMNVPYTMSVTQAVGATRAFRPAVVYPYHFRNQDNTYANLNSFKTQVGSDHGIEVRIRKWY